MNIEDLALSFVDIPSPDVFPEVKRELCPGSSLLQVTEENKEDRYRMKKQLLQFLLVPVAFITEELS